MYFVKNPECLVRVDRPKGEVVIRLAPVVKVKPAQHAGIQRHATIRSMFCDR
jgi:hypothetical protein